MSSSNSPCAACKFLRRKCTQECVFAPYFPPDNPAKFANVHKVFGASNVAKLLNDIPSPNREDAVNSLAYEAEARLRDPVYGCVGLISILQQRLKKIQMDLLNAKSELSAYIGSSAMLPMVYNPAYTQQHQHQHQHQEQQQQHLIINPSTSTSTMQYNNMPRVMDLMSSRVGPSNQQQQMIEAQQMAEVRENQELLRSYEQQLLIRQQMQHQQTHHHPQNDFTVGFNSGFDSDDASATPFIQINSPDGVPSTVIEQPNVNLGGFDSTSNPYHHQQDNEMPHHQQHQQQQNQLQTQHLLQCEQLQLQQPLKNQQQHNHNNQRPGSNEGRRSVDPSS